MVTPCTMKEYAAVLDFLDRSFNKPEKHWFAHNLEHIFQSTRDSVACHHLYKEEGKLCGVIGIYPMGLRIGKTILNVGGVGSVCTEVHSRDKGVMSKMLEQAGECMESAKYDVSWLRGDRFRYSNYGWDHGGRDLVLTVKLKDLKRYYPGIKPVKLTAVLEKDIPALDSVYTKLPSAMPRSPARWALQIQRGSKIWRRIDGKPEGCAGYLCLDKANPAEILEIAGDRMGAVSLLLAYLTEAHLDQIRIHYPDLDKDPLDGLLFELASSYELQHCHNIRVVDVGGAWKKLVPEMIKTPAGMVLGRAGFDKVKIEKDRRLILKRVLGFLDHRPAMPLHLKDYDALRPLKWWLSGADWV